MNNLKIEKKTSPVRPTSVLYFIYILLIINKKFVGLKSISRNHMIKIDPLINTINMENFL